MTLREALTEMALMRIALREVQWRRDPEYQGPGLAVTGQFGGWFFAVLSLHEGMADGAAVKLGNIIRLPESLAMQCIERAQEQKV